MFTRWPFLNGATIVGVLLWEGLLLALIIGRVPYTEIDFSTYLEHTRQFFLQGEHNYALIKGSSGPIAYPAGFLYIFEGIRRLCADGHYLIHAQAIFAGIYVLQLLAVLLIYKKCQVLQRSMHASLMLNYMQIGWPFMVMTTFSRRLHSIFVLRMFNDGIAMTIMHWAIFLLLLDDHLALAASLLFSLALSVKMNVLLFYPAWLLILLSRGGLKRAIQHTLAILLLQIGLAWPFLRTFPREYLSIAFNFKRKFLWEWTVNWRFLGPELFEHMQSSPILLLVHVLLLLCWAHFYWLRSDGGIPGFLMTVLWRRTSKPKSLQMPSQMAVAIFECNLIGVICSRSLHYQFLSWYFPSIPLLLARIGEIHWGEKIMLFLLIEYCWNVFPSTALSSILLLLSNILLLLLPKEHPTPYTILQH